MNRWLDKLERKFRGFGIDNLMLYLTGTMLAVYVAEVVTKLPIISMLSLDRAAIFGGQVWRLVTFIVIPPATDIIWIILSLYFFYFIGTSLQSAWGTTRFTIFYAMGMICAVIAGMIVGSGTNMYLNLSMFLAFAIIYPDHQIYLFFVIPVKVKYLAFVDLAVLLLNLIFGSWLVRAAVIASFIHIIIFFGDSLIDKIKNYKKYGAQRRNFRKSMKRQRDVYGNY